MQTISRSVVALVALATVAVSGTAARATADPSADAQTSTVSGTVSRADGGSPEGIVVVTRCENGFAKGDPTYSTTVSADGSYSLPTPAVPGAAPHTHCASALVEFRDPTGTYVSQFYDGAMTFDEATLVPGAAGDTALVPQFLSTPAGAIRGQVVDTYGRLVTDAPIRVDAWGAGSELSGKVAAPRGALDARGGFVLRSLPPGRYVVRSTADSRYAPGTTGWGQGIQVSAGRTATSPRVVVKERSRIQARATWHARSVTLRIRVTSRLTDRAVAGQVAAFVLHGGQRRHIRLHHGRAVVTIPTGRAPGPGGWSMYSVKYQESRHVYRSRASGDHQF